jgi:hypothetical protein
VCEEDRWMEEDGNTRLTIGLTACGPAGYSADIVAEVHACEQARH